MKRTATAYISLGSNVGDRQAHLCLALERLARRGVKPVAVSSLYETEHVGAPGEERPAYLNAVAAVATELSAPAILDVIAQVERLGGRDRPTRHAPRTIDIDLLLLGRTRLKGDRLTLPHPRMGQRAFVLLPLAEVAPGLRLPGGLTPAQAASRGSVAAQSVRRLDWPSARP
ncbi:MAG: 2-amino-4-hydroxy-6-hydroxymethyldihydropteridine diphosphokinase [Armatimonadetes bacterium]|nr:2-amino-4-hydroxy-6-hydroxymethyldihydropteridine diphosphokinase [Armatimonadota bacterium]